MDPVKSFLLAPRGVDLERVNRKILEESPLPGDLSLWRLPRSPALLELGEGAERGRCPAAWLCSQMWAEWRGRHGLAA